MTLAIPWNDNRIERIYRLLFAAFSFVPKTDSGAGEDANDCDSPTRIFTICLMRRKFSRMRCWLIW